MHYKSYLQLKKLLSSQTPLSVQSKNPAHDEWLFIISHQVYELWFKQILIELEKNIHFFYQKDQDSKEAAQTLLRFQRIIEIQKLLIKELKILETISTSNFLDFRHLLKSTSALQSFQFRLIEYKFGLQKKDQVQFHQKKQTAFFSKIENKKLEQAQKVNLFYGVQKWLETMPFIKDEGAHFKKKYTKQLETLYKKEEERIQKNENLNSTERAKNLSFIHQMKKTFHQIMDEKSYKELQKKGLWRFSHLALKASFIIQVYGNKENPPSYFFLPLQIIEALIEMDHQLTLWRFRHALMVKRILGVRPGTGGSTGIDYLLQTVEKHTVYKDFLQLRSFFLPNSFLPSYEK